MIITIKTKMHGKAQHVARPAQTRPQNSGVTGPTFIKFFIRVDVSSAVLKHASMLRSSHPLCNARAQNEGGVCNFHRFMPKTGFHIKVPWRIVKGMLYLSCVPILEICSSTFRWNWFPIGPLKRIWKKVIWAGWASNNERLNRFTYGLPSPYHHYHTSILVVHNNNAIILTRSCGSDVGYTVTGRLCCSVVMLHTQHITNSPYRNTHLLVTSATTINGPPSPF